MYVMYDTCNVLKFQVEQIYVMYDRCNVLKFFYKHHAARNTLQTHPTDTVHLTRVTPLTQFTELMPFPDLVFSKWSSIKAHVGLYFRSVQDNRLRLSLDMGAMAASLIGR